MTQPERPTIKKWSKKTRGWRKIHQVMGLVLVSLLAISAITGILLGWKKDVALLQPPTLKGEAETLADWLPLDSLERSATAAMHRMGKTAVELDRIDLRPSKGSAKFQYVPGYWEVQIDGGTGAVLSVKRRYSDLIEHIHDGSIISDLFKLISMNFLGLGLLLLGGSGLWLWYGPWKIRRLKAGQKAPGDQ